MHEASQVCEVVVGLYHTYMHIIICFVNILSLFVANPFVLPYSTHFTTIADSK